MPANVRVERPQWIKDKEQADKWMLWHFKRAVQDARVLAECRDRQWFMSEQEKRRRKQERSRKANTKDFIE